MLTPTGGLRPALIFSLVCLTLLLPSFVETAAAKTSGCSAGRQAYPLHSALPARKASCGQRVKDVQWLLGGHRPSVYTKTKPTFRWKPNGAYGARTKAAVKAMKFRIGYPQKGQCGARSNEVTDTAAAYFLRLLEGKTHRPTCWVGVAAERIKGIVVPGVTTAALKIKAFEVSQLGVHEQPAGSNRGPRISYRSDGVGPYQGSTGAYGLPWCASFGDYALKLIVGHGFGSANDAYVPTIAEYAQAHGWLQAKPRVGSFVAFLTAAGRLSTGYHIGYVVKVTASGVQTVEGNATDNYGGGVHEVWRAFNAWHMVYINVPGVA